MAKLISPLRIRFRHDVRQAGFHRLLCGVQAVFSQDTAPQASLKVGIQGFAHWAVACTRNSSRRRRSEPSDSSSASVEYSRRSRATVPGAGVAAISVGGEGVYRGPGEGGPPGAPALAPAAREVAIDCGGHVAVFDESGGDDDVVRERALKIDDVLNSVSYLVDLRTDALRSRAIRGGEREIHFMKTLQDRNGLAFGLRCKDHRMVVRKQLVIEPVVEIHRVLLGCGCVVVELLDTIERNQQIP